MSSGNVPEWLIDNLNNYNITQYDDGKVRITLFKKKGGNGKKCIAYFAGRTIFFMYKTLLETAPDYDVVCFDYTTYGYNKENGFQKNSYKDSYTNNYPKVSKALGNAMEKYYSKVDNSYEEVIMSSHSTGGIIISSILNFYTFSNHMISIIKRVSMSSPLIGFYPAKDTYVNLFKYYASLVLFQVGLGVSEDVDAGWGKNFKVVNPDIEGYDAKESYLTPLGSSSVSSKFLHNINYQAKRWDLSKNAIPIRISMAERSGSNPKNPIDLTFKGDTLLSVDTISEALPIYRNNLQVRTFNTGHDPFFNPPTHDKVYKEVGKFLYGE